MLEALLLQSYHPTYFPRKTSRRCACSPNHRRYLDKGPAVQCGGHGTGRDQVHRCVLCAFLTGLTAAHQLSVRHGDWPWVPRITLFHREYISLMLEPGTPTNIIQHRGHNLKLKQSNLNNNAMGDAS